MTLKFQDPDQYDVIVGAVPISGFAENSVISYAEDDDRFVIVKGVDGDVTRSKTVAIVATLMIHLMSSSKSNEVLSALHVADMLAPGGAGVVPLLIRDKNGTTVIASPTCFIAKPADVEFAEKANERAWKIVVVDGKAFRGGT